MERYLNNIVQGECLAELKKMPDEMVHCVITSPPYFGLRDYGVAGQIGLEQSPEEYVEHLVEVFREVRRVLRKDGTVWLNLGDSYAGAQASGDKKFGNEKFNKNRPSREFTKTPKKTKPQGLKSKDLIGIPWRVAFALQADGWYLRQDIIWHKPNPMPESVTDRCTKSHEYIFLLSKSPTYYFDNISIKEKSVSAGSIHVAGAEKHNGMKGFDTRPSKTWTTPLKRNKRSVWSVTTRPFKGAHFATFPEQLIEPMVLAGCPKEGVLLDPFMGSGTSAVVAKKNGRSYIGLELNPKYIQMAKKRLDAVILDF